MSTIMCFPFLGSAVVALGILALLQASSFIVNLYLTGAFVDSVHHDVIQNSATEGPEWRGCSEGGHC